MQVKLSGHAAKLGEYSRREPRDLPPDDVDVEALERDLRARVRGEVRFDGGTRGLYASDLSIYRQVPIGVVVPRDTDDVVVAVELCRRHGAPVLSRGCGSSLAGQTCNIAVVLDFSKYMHEVIEVDPERRIARVQPGCINDHLNDACAEHGLRFPPDPATHAWGTIGGAIGNNSCGTHSLMDPPGKTSDHVEELELLLYDGTRLKVGRHSEEEVERIIAEGGRRGEIYAALRDLRDRHAERIREEFVPIERRVSGFNLDSLLPENGFDVAKALVGTEGTCAIVLEATVRLVHDPGHRVTLVMGFEDIFAAGDHVPEMREHGPTGLEAFDFRIRDNLRQKGQQLEALELLPEGGGFLLAEFRGEDRDEARERAERLQEAIERHDDAPNMVILDDDDQQEMVWQVRESAIGASRMPGEMDTWATWEDGAVPVEKLGEYLRGFKELLDRHDLRYVIFGHFGQACVHMRGDNDLKTQEGIEDFRRFMEECAELTVRLGGSLSGEHGDGQLRGELLPYQFSGELIQAFDDFKRIWDPDWKLNPRKTTSDTYKMDENLRLGTGYNPPRVKTHFAFVDDHGSFAEATERCYGFGKCRRMEAETMCPSFKVTREEAHSTRGRTRLLFEMLQGEAVTGGWRDESVKESLDLCLACKGCKGDCPVNVDVATYKAEFFSHYYAGRLRPVLQYAMGLIPWWARVAERAPRLVNALSHAPVLADAGKRLVGLAPEREAPRFADETFRTWFARRGGARAHGRRVILWPDTFTNHFDPDVGKAAVEVLESHGLEVALPPGGLCCGRPLYDYGMLTLAKRFLRRILDAMADDIAAGVPVIGLEPSCTAVFRDELRNLFPHDFDAYRLARQTVTLSEFLDLHVEDYEPPHLEGRAIVQAHCHHKAVMQFNHDRSILGRMGLELHDHEECCGLAGSFGYERDKYEVSMAVGEQGILPSIREAPKDALVVADGFSCRSQIKHATDREGLHLSQVLRMAMDGTAPGGAYPERAAHAATNGGGRRATARQAVGAAATIGALGALALMRRRG